MGRMKKKGNDREWDREKKEWKEEDGEIEVEKEIPLKS